MSIKNSTLQKMARREWKKMDNPRSFHNKESKWVKTKNKYGMLEYQLMMVTKSRESSSLLPVKPKFGINK